MEIDLHKLMAWHTYVLSHQIMADFINWLIAHTNIVTYWFLYLISKCVILAHFSQYIFIDQFHQITLRFWFNHLLSDILYNSNCWCDSTSISICSPGEHVEGYMFITPSIISCWVKLYINQVTILILAAFKLTYIP